MNLFEFFGKAIEAGKKTSSTKDGGNRLHNELFEYMINHDKLYKEFIIPFDFKIKENKVDKNKSLKEFMPMVKKGCMEFYHTHKLKENPKSLFSKEFRKEMCEKLFDHYYETLTAENSDQEGGRMFENTSKKTGANMDYPAQPTRWNNGGIAESKELNERETSLKRVNTYQFMGTHGRYELFLKTKRDENSHLFLAVAQHPRTFKRVFFSKDPSRKGAIEELKKKIDSEIDSATKLSARATIDFNAPFYTEILGGELDNFYAKIIPGPKLVIAGRFLVKYMEDDPTVMKQEGFKKGTARRAKTAGEGSKPLPGIPLSAEEARATGLVANGRYVLGKESQDRDGNLTYEIELDSVVAAKNEPIELGVPGFTVGTERKIGENVELDDILRLSGLIGNK